MDAPALADASEGSWSTWKRSGGSCFSGAHGAPVQPPSPGAVHQCALYLVP